MSDHYHYQQMIGLYPQHSVLCTLTNINIPINTSSLSAAQLHYALLFLAGNSSLIHCSSHSGTKTSRDIKSSIGTKYIIRHYNRLALLPGSIMDSINLLLRLSGCKTHTALFYIVIKLDFCSCRYRTQKSGKRKLKGKNAEFNTSGKKFTSCKVTVSVRFVSS